MRKITLLLAALFILAPLAHAATTRVKVKDDFFKPNRVTIKKNDRVKWVWRGENVHNVAIKKPGTNKIVRASEFQTDGTFRHKFRKTGTWKVLCETHPDDMRMKVIVKKP